MRIRDIPVLLLPLALGAPQHWAGIAIAVLGGTAWLVGRGAWRRSFWALLVLAGAAFVGPLALAGRTSSTASISARVQGRYDQVWQSLDRDARRAVSRLGREVPDLTDRMTLFSGLESEVQASRDGNTLLVLDSSRTPVAWAGEGLLHEMEPADLPATGPTWRLGLTAATLAIVRPLVAHPGWSVVAARSFSTDSLPSELVGWESVPGSHWSLAPGGMTPPAGVNVIAGVDGQPSLWLHIDALRPTRSGAAVTRIGRIVGAFALALALIAAASFRRESAVTVPLLLGGAVVCAARGWGLTWADGIFMGLGAAGAWAAWRTFETDTEDSATSGGSRVAAWAVLALQIAAAGWWIGRGGLEAAMLLSPITFAALTGSAAMLIAAVFAPRLRAQRTRTVWLLALLVLTLVLAPGLTAPPSIRLLCLALAVVATTVYLARRMTHGTVPAIALLLLGTALGGAAWSLLGAVRETPSQAGTISAPPTTAEVAAEREKLAHALDTVVPESWLIPDLDHLDPQDLALFVWRHSPLARSGLLSALSVFQDGRLISSFSFGLPMQESGELDRSPTRWQDLQLSGWDNALSAGRGRLRGVGDPLTLRYWALLRPGFRLNRDIEGNLAAGLLRSPTGEGSGQLTALDLQRQGEQAARLRPSRLGGLFTALNARINRGRFISAAVVAATVLLSACVAIGALLVLWVPAGRLREFWRNAWHSYSQRLVMVFALLVLLTLLPLNAVMVGVVSRRLDTQQLQDGLASLESTQRVLGEYVLSLEPGFSLGTTLNDELLTWLSRVVHHQVNLYWGSAVYASSRPELFTAGLLPVRIPGEIYSRLALRGAPVASRRNRIGETTYLELYAPLRIPGAPSQERLFVSLPLLAQQEAVASELATLRRRTLLSAGFLFLLLSAVGARLARSFTRPLHQIVEATESIAAGADSIDIAPADVELAALARAIDEMAHRIAQGRERLLGEKRLMEKVVENVTSGVVSLDSAGRVMMCNRVARQLLHVEPGVDLEDTLRQRAELEPVREVLGDTSVQPAARTLQLGSGDAGSREWTAIHVELPGPGDPASLLVVEDVTEVLRGQRLAAWAEMARIIAHEIKNPLTPIQLSTEHLREVWKAGPSRFGPVLERCTDDILQQVEELRQIASEFSTFSHIPRLELRRGDVVAAVQRTVESYRASGDKAPQVELVDAPTECQASFDARLLGRAMRNLLENALRAAGDAGRVEVRMACDPQEVRIAVSDSGPGVPPEDLGRIFDPYFSTHESGTGLGLPITRRIAEEHGGTLTARNESRMGGLEVTLRLPREPAQAETPANDAGNGTADGGGEA